jgi:hypothetical protein
MSISREKMIIWIIELKISHGTKIERCVIIEDMTREDIRLDENLI